MAFTAISFHKIVISGQFLNFKPFENTSKPLVFCCFQGGYKMEPQARNGLTTLNYGDTRLISIKLTLAFPGKIHENV